MFKSVMIGFVLAATLVIPCSVLAEGPVATKPNEVAGLKLPEAFKVPYNEGFVTITAECEGSVEWIVLLSLADEKSKARIKYKVGSDPKSLDVSVPPENCVITIYCYGYADSKLTKAAKCDIIVLGARSPPLDDPDPKPPDPKPVSGNPLVVTVVYDPITLSSDYSLITRWAAASRKLIALGHKPYLKSIKDPAVVKWLGAAGAKNKDFAEATKKAGSPLIVIQDKATGKALAVIPCPKTSEELDKILAGGK